MPSAIKPGISAAGAAVNNYNVVNWHTGRRMVRSTVVAAGAFAARSVMSRVALNEADKIDSYTLQTS